jgi:hypothetical protein
MVYFEKLAQMANYHPNIMKIIDEIQNRIEEEALL